MFKIILERIGLLRKISVALNFGASVIASKNTLGAPGGQEFEPPTWAYYKK